MPNAIPLGIIPDWEFRIESDAVAAFAAAVRFPATDGTGAPIVPTTFPVVGSAVQVRQFLYDVLKLDPHRVLHGEQRYRYFGKLKPGDRLLCSLRLASDRTKTNRSGRPIRVIEREITMKRLPDRELLLIEQTTTIEIAEVESHGT